MRTMKQVVSEQRPEGVICPQCGAALPSHAHFCRFCGVNVADEEETTVIATTPDVWGWLPVLSLTSAIGVLLVSLAYNAGRFALQGADTLFWLGLLVLIMPVAVRLFMRQPGRHERVALLVVLGMALYLVKYMQYPLYFTYFDELIHVRSAQDLLASGYLFSPNPILAISPLYPGLEIATTALSNLTGLSLFASGMVLIGVARLLLVLALYLLCDFCTRSPQTAGIATLLYMTNPGFLFFDSDFAYESLAISLAIFVVFAMAFRSYVLARRNRGLSVAIWLSTGAVVITHHVTSFVLAAFLVFWTVVFFVFSKIKFLRPKRSGQVQANPGGVAWLTLALCAGWLLSSGNLAAAYLGPYLTGAVGQLTRVLFGQGAMRQTFQGDLGFVVPVWERLVAYGSVALIMLGLAFGLFQIWRHYRGNALVLALAGAGLAYPVGLALRLTASGAEVSERTSEFVFFGVGLVLAIAVSKLWTFRAPNWWRSGIIAIAVGVIFLGQTIVGNGQIWARLPGPYLVVADQRSVEPEGIAAAQWAASFLGPGQRIAADRINMLLMSTYGGQWDVNATNAPVSVQSIFTELQFDSTVQAALRVDKVQYLVVDRRLSTGLPLTGTYFDLNEPGQNLYDKPIDPAALAKFDGVQNVNRVFDSGNIIIYDVRAVT